jgi:hypothetical protein
VLPMVRSPAVYSFPAHCACICSAPPAHTTASGPAVGRLSTYQLGPQAEGRLAALQSLSHLSRVQPTPPVDKHRRDVNKPALECAESFPHTRISKAQPSFSMLADDGRFSELHSFHSAVRVQRGGHSPAIRLGFQLQRSSSIWVHWCSSHLSRGPGCGIRTFHDHGGPQSSSIACSSHVTFYFGEFGSSSGVDNTAVLALRYSM